MDATKVASMSDPLSAEAPCGPDLEAAGDADYLNALTRLDGGLPDSFFNFEKTSIDFEADSKILRNLIERSRDLRLLVLLSKWSILYRDLLGFVDCVEAIAILLTNYWAFLHPTAPDGDTSYRGAVLQTLDDMPTVILPLQHATLFSTRRTGALNFRNQMVASGEVAARPGETAYDSATIKLALTQIDPDELVSLRDVLGRLKQAVSTVRTTSIEQGGAESAPDLKRLAELTDRMFVFVDGAVPRESQIAGPSDRLEHEPDASPAAAAGTSASSMSTVTSPSAAASALARIAAYYQRNEPSSPSLLLIRQAQQLAGRNFYEILQILFPKSADEAKIDLGGEPTIFINLDQSPKEDGQSLSENLNSDSELAEEQGKKIDFPEGESEAIEAQLLYIGSRQEAQNLLGEVAKYYRVIEPSNPIPILCDRARAMSSLGFTDLIKQVFPREQ